MHSVSIQEYGGNFRLFDEPTARFLRCFQVIFADALVPGDSNDQSAGLSRNYLLGPQQTGKKQSNQTCGFLSRLTWLLSPVDSFSTKTVKLLISRKKF